MGGTRAQAKGTLRRAAGSRNRWRGASPTGKFVGRHLGFGAALCITGIDTLAQLR